MRKLVPFLLCFGLFLAFSFPIPHKEEIGKLIDIKGLRRGGDDWKVIHENIGPEGGSIKLFQDKWLMYFLHWRPLSKDKEILSIEYVKKLMLSFWSPNMPFTLSEKGGELEIAGHRAFYVDGTIYKGMIHTRFIVWNCPETNRQFIADCNINVRRGTPEKLLAMQEKISQTIACHSGVKGKDFPSLNQKYANEKYGISFSTPDNWHTDDYSPYEWFPEGMLRETGSLWTLLTDSEKYVEIIWNPKQKEISRGLFLEYIRRLMGSRFKTESGTDLRVLDITIEHIELKDDYVVGEGSFYFYLKREENEGIKPYRFKTLLWEDEDTTYFLLASLAALEKFWGRPVDLTPKKEILDRYFWNEVVPNVLVAGIINDLREQDNN